MEVKDKKKRSASQTKRLAASKSSSTNSDSNTSENVPQKNKARNGVLLYHNHKGRKNPKHKGYHNYYVLRKKSGIPGSKYKYHTSENRFGCRSHQESIKEVLQGILGNRSTAIKH